MIKSQKHHQGKGAFDLIEEAVHLLRTSPLRLLAPYYIGSLPFVLGLLFFWADMSHSAFAAGYCGIASLVMALLFIWMKTWQAIFMRGVKNDLFGITDYAWSGLRVMKLILVQTFIQPSGLILLPVATVLILPFAWFYAFYQNVSMEGDGQSLETHKTIRESWALAKLWSGQNLFILFILALFGFFVFINLGMAMIILPGLLKTFLGVESMFTISGIHILNTTFLMTALGATYLCLDPLVKTIYALRCFYGKSIANGDDLKTDFKRFHIQKKSGLLIVILAMILGLANTSQAQKAGNPVAAKKTVVASPVKPDELDRAIKEIMDQDQFTWRMPREKQAMNDQPKGFLGKIMDSINDFLKKTARSIQRAIERFLKWLNKLFPEPKEVKQPKDLTWIQSTRAILYFMIAILVCMGLMLGYKLWQRHKKEKSEIQAEETIATPDLNAAEISPADLVSRKWLTLAENLIKEGSLRLALRAIYLGILAGLAEQGFISIAKYKSNRDYLKELRRREHAVQGLVKIFSEDVGFFDKVWYGMYEVAMQDLNLFRSDYERILNLVKQ